MIQFPCRCGHCFQLDDDQAGGLIQCPKCARLNDVPKLSEVASIGEDGTYLLSDDLAPARRQSAAAHLMSVYHREARDEQGNEIDRRTPQSDIDLIGGEPLPLDPSSIPKPQAPRYDPETGELIAPIELSEPEVPTVDPATIPIAKPALNYATGATALEESFANLFVRLLMPINLAVLFAVLLMHVMTWPVLLVTYAGFFFFWAVTPLIGALILAHYGNVIEDAGPFDRDELPRPLRELGFYEDIWYPFCNVFCSLFLCYGPAFIVAGVVHVMSASAPLALGVLGLGACIGSFFFPAVLLTLQCGGTILNLRPDRVGSVISLCGAGYVFVVGLWVVAAGVYLLGWLGTSVALASVFFLSNVPNWMTSWLIVLPALVAGIILTHWFCLSLALLYRRHHAQFPWVLQHHVSTRTVDEVGASAPPRGGFTTASMRAKAK